MKRHEVRLEALLPEVAAEVVEVRAVHALVVPSLAPTLS
jgi:hypothetical protein